MKIVYVIPGAVFGGAHNQVAELMPEIESLGHDIHVLLPREDGNAAHVLRTRGVSVQQIRLRRIREPRRLIKNFMFLALAPVQFLRLVRIFRSLQPDIVQIHGITQVDVALAARFCGVALIWQLLDTRAPWVLCLAFRPFLQKLPQVVMSTGYGTLNAHLLGRSAKPVVRCYLPPIRKDLGRKSSMRSYARAALDVEDDSLLVLAVGNLNPQKGHENLIDAVAKVETECKVVLRIRGSASPQHPGYLEQLQRKASECGLGESVVGHFDGEIDVPDAMVAADVLCLASRPRSEGIPTVILEGMSCGLPILSSKVGSVTEVIEDGRQGYLHESGDIELLTAQIECLARDPGEVRRLADASRAKSEELATVYRWIEVNLDVHELAMSRLIGAV